MNLENAEYGEEVSLSDYLSQQLKGYLEDNSNASYRLIEKKSEINYRTLKNIEEKTSNLCKVQWDKLCKLYHAISPGITSSPKRNDFVTFARKFYDQINSKAADLYLKSNAQTLYQNEHQSLEETINTPEKRKILALMTAADDLKTSKLTREQIILVTGEKGLDAAEEMCKDGILTFQEGIFFLNTESQTDMFTFTKKFTTQTFPEIARNLNLEAHEKYGNQCSSVGFVCYLSDEEVEEKKKIEMECVEKIEKLIYNRGSSTKKTPYWIYLGSGALVNDVQRFKNNGPSMGVEQ